MAATRARGNRPKDQFEGGLGSASSEGAVPAQRVDRFGTVIPDPAQDPEGYAAWHAGNLAAQSGGAYGIERQQELGQTDVMAGIEADRDRVMSGQPSAPTGQLDPGTRPGATLDQILSRVPTAPGGAQPTALRSPSFSGAQPAGVGALQNKVADRIGTITAGGQVANPSKVEIAAGQARDALGPAPQMDVGFADRQLGAYQEALGMSREVLDRLLNGPSVAEKVGSRALENQLAVARSARGGPGAVQDALNAAQQQAPMLQAQASQQAVSEQNQNLATAGNVASSFAQAALGARGQDIQIESENTRAATTLMQEITKLTGTQLQLDQQNEQFIGQMARDWAQLDFDFSKMAVDQQEAWFDRQVQIYGIDQQVAAQMKAIAAQEGIGPADWFNGIVGILGAGATVGAAAIDRPKGP
jgi:hypothetical protein